MIENLEKNLRAWCKTKDEKLFTEQLYDAFRYYAASICTKSGIKTNEMEALVADLVSETWLTLPAKYDETKGTAKAMLYKVMSNYLNDKIRHDHAGKRDKKLLFFLEEMSDELNTSYLSYVEIDLFEFYKNTIIKRKEIFDGFEKKMHKRISAMILDAIEHPEAYKPVRGSFSGDIARKCQVTLDDVGNVMKMMRKAVAEAELLE